MADRQMIFNIEAAVRRIQAVAGGMFLPITPNTLYLPGSHQPVLNFGRNTYIGYIDGELTTVTELNYHTVRGPIMDESTGEICVYGAHTSQLSSIPSHHPRVLMAARVFFAASLDNELAWTDKSPFNLIHALIPHLKEEYRVKQHTDRLVGIFTDAMDNELANINAFIGEDVWGVYVVDQRGMSIRVSYSGDYRISEYDQLVDYTKELEQDSGKPHTVMSIFRDGLRYNTQEVSAEPQSVLVSDIDEAGNVAEITLAEDYLKMTERCAELTKEVSQLTSENDALIAELDKFKYGTVNGDKPIVE